MWFAMPTPRGYRAADDRAPGQAFGTLRLVGFVLLPFVTGYFLSYYFRTVSAVLATRLASDLSLNAAQLGVATGAYFFAAALAQLPIGWALDRFGPRSVQIVCLTIAGAGAALFSRADDVPTLFGSRALIGFGVASALLAGLKAIAMISSSSRLGLYYGVYMCLGALGAVAASAPTERLLLLIDWRELFLLLAAACITAALFIGLLAPRGLASHAPNPASTSKVGFREILQDRFFWRLAPLSATAIGSAWALQGLWSAPWLRDVAELDATTVAQHLFFMAIALSAGALGFGVILHRLASAGIPPERTMAAASLTYIAAEVALALSSPAPPLICWAMISAFGAGTVLTFTMSAQHFPKESVGRANSAFNLFHFSAAFGVQSAFGAVVSQWPSDALGRYPAEAYKMAFLCLIAVQVTALLWFLRPSGAANVSTRSASWFGSVLPRLAAWGCLTCVALNLADPLQRQVAAGLRQVAPAFGFASHQPNAAEMDRLEARVVHLEARIIEKERELIQLAGELARRGDRDLWLQKFLDEIGGAFLKTSWSNWSEGGPAQTMCGR